MKDEDRQLGLRQYRDNLAVECGLSPELVVLMRRQDNKIAAARTGGLRHSLSEMVLLRMDGLDLEACRARGLLGALGDLDTFAVVLTMLVFGLGDLFR
jgi:hypothetical protein